MKVDLASAMETEALDFTQTHGMAEVGRYLWRSSGPTSFSPCFVPLSGKAWCTPSDAAGKRMMVRLEIKQRRWISPSQIKSKARALP